MGLFRIPGIAELEKDISRLEDDLVEVNKTLNSIFERTGRIEEDTDAINSSVGDGLKGTVGDIKAATQKTVEAKIVTVLDVADDIDTSIGTSAGVKLNNLITELTAVGTNVAAVRSSVGTRLSATASNILAEVGQINASVGSGLRALVVSLGTNVAAVKISVGTGLAGTVSQLGATVSSGLGWLTRGIMVLVSDLSMQRPQNLGLSLSGGTLTSQGLYNIIRDGSSQAANLIMYYVNTWSEPRVGGTWVNVVTVTLGNPRGASGMRALVGWSGSADSETITFRLIDSSGQLAISSDLTAREGVLVLHSPHAPISGRKYTVQVKRTGGGTIAFGGTVALIGENPTSLPTTQGDAPWPESDSPRPRYRLFRRLSTMLRSCAARLLRPWRQVYRIARTWIASTRR